MTDQIQDVLAPAAIERAIEIYCQLRDCEHSEVVQARKTATDHVYALIDGGERDEQQLVIGALAHLKALERARAATSATGKATARSAREKQSAEKDAAKA